MFSGIIQNVGTLVAMKSDREGATLQIRSPAWERALDIGESIAVDGVCLTLTDWQRDNDTMSFDVLQETLHLTSLGNRESGAKLNLERSLRFGDPVGGHFVTGHVDGTGMLQKIDSLGRDRVLQIACEDELLQGMVYKGSIACNGISLTLTDVASNSFQVHVIPHTWTATSCCDLEEGDLVNIETDSLGKYIRKYITQAL